MWLGDISKLPESEQYYLRSENIEADHSIGSEFYDGQIECIFTDLSKEDELYKSRSLFLEACYQKFGIKIASLDKEVLELSLSFNAPIIDTNKEYKHIADTLNKTYLESFDKEAMSKIIEKFGGNPEKLGSNEPPRGRTSRYRKVIRTSLIGTQISSYIPFLSLDSLHTLLLFFRSRTFKPYLHSSHLSKIFITSTHFLVLGLS